MVLREVNLSNKNECILQNVSAYKCVQNLTEPQMRELANLCMSDYQCSYLYIRYFDRSIQRAICIEQCCSKHSLKLSYGTSALYSNAVSGIKVQTNRFQFCVSNGNRQRRKSHKLWPSKQTAQIKCFLTTGLNPFPNKVAPFALLLYAENQGIK